MFGLIQKYFHAKAITGFLLAMLLAAAVTKISFPKAGTARFCRKLLSANCTPSNSDNGRTPTPSPPTTPLEEQWISWGNAWNDSAPSGANGGTTTSSLPTTHLPADGQLYGWGAAYDAVDQLDTSSSDNDDGSPPPSTQKIFEKAWHTAAGADADLMELVKSGPVENVKQNLIAKYTESDETFPYQNHERFIKLFQGFKDASRQEAELVGEVQDDQIHQVQKDVLRVLEGESDKCAMHVEFEKILLSYIEIMSREYVACLVIEKKQTLPKYKQEDGYVLVSLMKGFRHRGRIQSEHVFWMFVYYMTKRKESDEDIFPGAKEQKNLNDIGMHDNSRAKYVVLNMIKDRDDKLATALWCTMIAPDEQYAGATHGDGPALRIIGTLVTQLSGCCFNDTNNMLKTSSAMKVKLITYIFEALIEKKLSLHQVTLGMVASYLIWHCQKGFEYNIDNFMKSMTEDGVRVTNYEFTPLDDSFLESRVLEAVLRTSRRAYNNALYLRKSYDNILSKYVINRIINAKKRSKEELLERLNRLANPLAEEKRVSTRDLRIEIQKARESQQELMEAWRSESSHKIYEWDPWCRVELTKWSDPVLEKIFG